MAKTEQLIRTDAQNRVLHLMRRIWAIQLDLCGGDHQRAAIIIDQAARLAEPKVS